MYFKIVSREDMIYYYAVYEKNADNRKKTWKDK